MGEKIPKGWKKVKLGEVATTNPENIGKNYPYKEIVYLDTGSITENKIENLQKFRLKDAPSRAKRMVKNEDIIYSTVRPIQRHYGFIKNPPENLVVSTGFTVIRVDNGRANSKFIYYFLILDEIVETLDAIAEGSTSAYPSLRPDDIKDLGILLPPLPEQKAIAAVLSSLDDKIDLLHRENKTLEKMAETLFRQWFIEEAKDSWEEKKLGEIVEVRIGRTPPRKEFQWFSKDRKDVKWVSIKDLGENGVYIFNTSEYLTHAAISKFSIPIIPKDTVLLSFKMTVGRVGITTEPMVSNEAIAHFVFKDETPVTTEYLYFFLKLFKYKELGSTSTIVTSINSKMIKDFKILIPGRNKLSKFDSIAKTCFEKIRQNQQQIRTLEKLRDTLLPKLMSGKVRVRG